MAQTRFSGPVKSDNGFEGDITGDVIATSLVLPTATAAELGDEDDAINTTGKVDGKAVVDLADGLIYVATGDDVNDKWVASDGTTDITPA
jgi:cytoskeletal protein CcmA (bactofilin family)